MSCPVRHGYTPCMLQIYELAKETVVLLLDFNPDTQGLLDWVIDRCYTGANEVADGCFNALAAVFQTRSVSRSHRSRQVTSKVKSRSHNVMIAIR